MPENHYEVDYNGWIIKVKAETTKQARYRALIEWRKEYPNTDFVKFMREARESLVPDYMA